MSGLIQGLGHSVVLEITKVWRYQGTASSLCDLHKVLEPFSLACFLL